MRRPVKSVAVSPRYVRSLKKLSPSIQQKVIERERIFRADAFDPSLNTHKLKGPLKFLWSWSVNFNHRVLFEFTGSHSALFHDVGTHDVYE